MADPSFTLMATVSASTKRSPDISGGIIGAAETHIASLSCFPLDPVDPEIQQRIPNLAGAQELLQTFVQGGLDIDEGDILIVSSTEYPIRAVEDWSWPHDPNDADYQRLILEQPK
jgi:hypothetical protein